MQRLAYKCHDTESMCDRETAIKIFFFFTVYDEKATAVEMGVHTDHSFINDWAI